MEKTGIILILLMLISACTVRKAADKKEVFKNYVGSENFHALDQFLLSMEKKLEETYRTGSLRTNLKKYVEKVADGDSGIKFNQKDCNSFRSYELSGMEPKFTREKYDTVYFSGEDIVTVIGQDTGWEILILNKSKEEILNEFVEKGHNKLIHWGRLTGGLEKIAGQDSLIVQYVDFRNRVGNINPQLVAKYILESKVDFSENYFHRLIVLVELYYREIKEYGC